MNLIYEKWEEILEYLRKDLDISYKTKHRSGYLIKLNILLSYDPAVVLLDI